MTNLMKVVYAIEIDDTTKVLKQIWIHEDYGDKLKMPNFDNDPHAEFIAIITKLESDRFPIKIINLNMIEQKDYYKEIGKEWV